MTKRYLQLQLNGTSINLDEINNRCIIDDSSIQKSVDINDDLPNPENWSRDNLIKQFNLLSVYPWFWKQSLKNELNKAFDLTPLIKVKPDGYDQTVNISELKHYNDIEGVKNMF